MERRTQLVCLSTLGLLMLLAGPLALRLGAADDEGFRPIFDGKTLEGWDGNPEFWGVQEGCIVGETTPENRTKGNTFIIWRGGQPGDFELKLEYRLRNHNSGVQFRSWEEPDKWGKWVIGGYQSDMEASGRYSGILYGEKYRGILCQRGDKVVIGSNHKPKVVGKVGDSKELLARIDRGGWNEMHIIADGNHIVHKINGQAMIDVTDEDTEMRRADGLIAFQLHAGPPMKVEFRNIRLKEKKAPAAKSDDAQKQQGDKKKIVLIAGRRSHGYGSHEHNAGCLLLAKCLEQNVPNLETVVYRNGWPKEEGALEGADAIVIFCDGGGGHVVNPHLQEVDKLMKQGVGLACLHYGVEVPKGKQGDCVKDWIGGYFETHWSVNPHWTAEFEDFPKHPITRGVKPFVMNDEWYYHMRFVDDMKGVTPILTAVPPDSTRQRRDGPHSGNPTVRARKGMAEHVAWARVRPDGGRGFGFTGGHWHWSWACDSFRRVVLNAIVWIAGIEVPEGGVPSKTPSFEELEANQDYPQPKNFDRQRWLKEIEQWKKNEAAE